MRLKKPVPRRDNGEAILLELKERLRRMKLRVPQRPKDEKGNYIDPQVPPDITKLNDEQLGKLHSQFAAMMAYVYGQVGLRAVERAIAEQTNIKTRAHVRLVKTGTVADKQAKVETDSRAETSGEMLLVAQSAEGLTQAIFNAYQVGRDLCSRELTRRMNVYSPSNR